MCGCPFNLGKPFDTIDAKSNVELNNCGRRLRSIVDAQILQTMLNGVTMVLVIEFEPMLLLQTS